MKPTPPLAVEHSERLIDEALEETFPASDSISPAVELDNERSGEADKCLQPGVNGEVNRAGIEELDASIAAVRENLRQLVEQAPAYSGAADEDFTLARIAEQEAWLDTLKRQRAQLG
jgi:hypothetical protein